MLSVQRIVYSCRKRLISGLKRRGGGLASNNKDDGSSNSYIIAMNNSVDIDTANEYAWTVQAGL